MGYDYLIRVMLADYDALLSWPTQQLIDYTQKLREGYRWLKTTRDTFPEFGVKTRGWFSVSPKYYDRNTHQLLYRLTDELKLFSELVPELKLDVFYGYFNLEFAIVYELYQGQVTKITSMELTSPTFKLGRVHITPVLDFKDCEIDDDIQHIFENRASLQDWVKLPSPSLGIAIQPTNSSVELPSSVVVPHLPTALFQPHVVVSLAAVPQVRVVVSQSNSS